MTDIIVLFNISNDINNFILNCRLGVSLDQDVDFIFVLHLSFSEY
jgi:hypothetical protein